MGRGGRDINERTDRQTERGGESGPDTDIQTEKRERQRHTLGETERERDV